jgi:hypothetical protein
MPTTGCTIQNILPSDTPNEGRIKINNNFNCLINGAFSGASVNLLGATLNGSYFSSPKQIIEPNEVLNIPLNFEYNVTKLSIDGSIVMDGDLNII